MTSTTCWPFLTRQPKVLNLVSHFNSIYCQTNLKFYFETICHACALPVEYADAVCAKYNYFNVDGPYLPTQMCWHYVLLTQCLPYFSYFLFPLASVLFSVFSFIINTRQNITTHAGFQLILLCLFRKKQKKKKKKKKKKKDETIMKIFGVSLNHSCLELKKNDACLKPFKRYPVTASRRFSIKHQQSEQIIPAIPLLVGMLKCF